MKEFSARQGVANLALTWPGLEATRLAFPFAPPAQSLALEPPTQVLAEALESEPVRARLAELIKPLLGPAELVGFPAVLGMRRSAEVSADLAARLGRAVFEMPTFPPSVPGLRLRDALISALAESGATFLPGQPARAPRVENGRVVALTVGEEPEVVQVEARAFLLATGRFLGRGLAADRRRVREGLFNLPVAQPASREEWHRESFWDRRGHPLNRAGLEVDGAFRPLGDKDRPAYSNLFAAGVILAHQDWVRQKCGAGLALATAWGAVKGLGGLA
jgi:glycerol-3-phosphate dehydrogenase subunit B